MFEGGCFCGNVRYRLKRRPMFVNCCHCTDCQIQTGGAFAINALIEASEVEILSGRPKAFSMKTESGRPHDIHRCPDCGVAVWSDYGRRGWMIFIRVSTLDRPHDIVPDAHIFARSKLPWVRLPDDARVFDIYYDMAKEWSAESLKRRNRAEAAARAATG
jgi:hypothetical protein